MVIPMQGLAGDIVTLVEGSNARFECNAYKKNCPHPCEWSDVKAYFDPIGYE